MDLSDYARLRAGTEMGDHSGILQEIIKLTENLDCYEIYHDIKDYDDLERYYIEELDAIQVPKHLKNYIDYEAYGQDIAIDENGTFTDQVYVWDTGSSFHEFYDGERSSIPDVYRVMTFWNELPQKKNPSGPWILPLTWASISGSVIRIMRQNTRRNRLPRRKSTKT